MTKQLLVLALLTGHRTKLLASRIRRTHVRNCVGSALRSQEHSRSNGGPGTSDPGRYSYYSATLTI